MNFLSHIYDFSSIRVHIFNLGFYWLDWASMRLLLFAVSLLTFAMSFFLCPQITFQFIATFVTLVPLVDCSSVLHERTDLSEVKPSRAASLVVVICCVIMPIKRPFAESHFTKSWCLSFRWRERCAQPPLSLKTLCFSSWTGELKCDLTAFTAGIELFSAHPKNGSHCIIFFFVLFPPQVFCAD